MIILVSLIILIFLILLWIALYNLVFLYFQKKHRLQQTKNIRFLQIRIQKKSVAKSSDIDATDHTQQVKNNIELMNQVYKNFYSIYRHLRSVFESNFSQSFFGDLKYRLLGWDYISMELLIEKWQIKYIMWVSEQHLSTVKKMVAAFYPDSFIEEIEQPKLLDAGKYMAGWEFNFTEHSIHPIKTYEAFEADPMDSILSAYNNVNKDEKMILQILVEPLPSKRLKKMRKRQTRLNNEKILICSKNYLSEFGNDFQMMKPNMRKTKKKIVNMISLNNKYEILTKKLMMKYLEQRLEHLLCLQRKKDQIKW